MGKNLQMNYIFAFAIILGASWALQFYLIWITDRVYFSRFMQSVMTADMDSCERKEK